MNDKNYTETQLLSRPIKNMEGDVGRITSNVEDLNNEVKIINGGVMQLKEEVGKIDKDVKQISQIKIPSDITIHLDVPHLKEGLTEGAIFLAIAYLIGVYWRAK